MPKVTQLPTMTVQASGGESVTINDIEMTFNPSDIHMFDSNFMFEQTFLRSNSVYCYRSKYADTKVVLTFPFDITRLVDADFRSDTYKFQDDSHLSKCIRLIKQLDSYPFTFIKSPRLQTYISPRVTSQTGYLMFAVEELALIQAAAASNLVFLEVTLRYFNYAPFTPDFSFISNRTATLLDQTTKTDISGIDRSYLTKLPPEYVYDLASSEVWSDYMNPKLSKLITKLKDYDLLYRTDKVVKPELDVTLGLPIVISSVVNGERKMQDSDGMLIGPGSKKIVTTNLNPMDALALSPQLYAMLEQDEAKRSGREEEKDADKGVTASPFSTDAEVVKQKYQAKQAFPSSDPSNELLSTLEELFVQYTDASFIGLGLAVQRLEVRKANSLVSHKIGSHKHPVIQYLGRQPARTSIQFISNSKGSYKTEEDVGASAFITNAMQVLEDNRIEFPAAEIYNHIKIRSLSNILLDAENAVPNQTVVSATADQQGVESITYTFTQNSSEKFLDQLNVEASGARSISKASETATQILIEWLGGFHAKLKATNDFSKLHSDAELTERSLNILRTIFKVLGPLTKELGYENKLDFLAGSFVSKLASDNTTISIAKSKTGLSTYRFNKNQGGSGVQPLYFSIIEATLTEEEIAYNISSETSEGIGRSIVSWLENMFPGTAEGVKQDEKKRLLKEVEDSYPSPITSYALSTWACGYAKILLEGRLASLTDKPTKLRNVNFNKDGLTDMLILNAVKLIDVDRKANPITDSLSEGSRLFLNNLKDIYLGSLFGQALDDLGLEDLDPDYDKEKDIVIQSTDPFFFIDNMHFIKDDMWDFYNETYAADKILPMAAINKDLAYLDKVAETEAALDLDLSLRKMREVAFDADSFTYANMSAYSDVDGVVTGSRDISSLIDSNPDVVAAIEGALSKFGLSNDNEFRMYMYKVAFLESSMGKKLTNKSGAQGLFQFMHIAVKDIMEKPNKVFNEVGYVNLSRPQSTRATEAVMADPSFKTNHKLSSELFIQRFLNTGGKHYHPKTKQFSEALTYSYHNIGAGFHVEAYLSSNRNHYSTNYWHNTDPKSYYVDQYYKQKVQLFAQTDVSRYAKGSVQSTNQVGKSTNLSKTGIEMKGKVKNIVDGDTLTIVTNDSLLKTSEYKVRLAGIDTVETKKQAAAGVDNSKYNEAIAHWGKKASNLLYSLAPPGSSVTFKYFDLDAIPGSDRVVGTIRNAQGKDVAEVIVNAGLAVTSRSADQKYREGEATAKKSKIGMWADPEVSGKSSPVVDSKAVKALEPEQEILKGVKRSTAVMYHNWVPFNDGGDHRVTSPYTFTEPRKGRKTPHRGLDLRASIGTTVIAAAAGTVLHVRGPDGNGGGKRIAISHGNGFQTNYMHLSQFLVKAGQKVKAFQPIAKSGDSGSPGQPHLHYEVLYRGRHIHPFSTRYPLYMYSSDAPYNGVTGMSVANSEYGGGTGYISTEYEDRPGITMENTVYNENALAKAILDNAKEGINLGLKGAIPTIKAYMVIGNENDGLGLDTMNTGSQLYELKGISSYKQVCNNTDSPVDTVVMTIIDPSFANTDSWTSYSRSQMPGIIDPTKIGTDAEIQFKASRLKLRVGTKMQIRLGYGNDPNTLPIVFNGGIMDISNVPGSNQMLNLLLEGYGKELLQEIQSPSEPTKLDNDHNSPTTVVIGKTLLSKPIDNFGYMNSYVKWFLKDENENDPEARNMVKGTFNSGASWFFNVTSASRKSRLYMNIFAPEVEAVDDEYAKYWGNFFNSWGLSMHQFGYPFYIYKMTPWDSCKQMEYRHPGTIFKPMIFEDRMTIFYGIKEQMYFARDLSRYTQVQVAQELKAGEERTGNSVDYFARRRERMEPVSNIHMVSSSTNLISNQMKLNGQFSTVSKVEYFTDNSDVAKSMEWKTVDVQIDDNILPWEIREKSLKLTGAHGKYTGILYGISDLKKEAEKMYAGSILITGNARVKAGDYIFIDDVENRLHGLCLVRDCIQHFDSVNGFVTEIVPGLYVEPAQFMYTTLWLQLMATYKVGSLKMRLNAYIDKPTEFSMVKEYLALIQQLSLADDKSGIYDKAYTIAQYGTVASLFTYMSYSLARTTNLSTRMPMSNAYRFTKAGLMGLFSNARQLETSLKLKNQLWYQTGKGALSWAKDGAKTRIIGSTAYQAYRASAVAKGVNTARSSVLYRVPAWALKTTSKAASWALVRSSLATISAIAATNPLGLLIDVVVTLAASWAIAKIEEKGLTRQPIMYFPLIKHGRPYQAGITGFSRNTYIDSLKSEFSKTMTELYKASQIFEGNNIANNKETGALLNILLPYARKQAAVNKYANTDPENYR